MIVLQLQKMSLNSSTWISKLCSNLSFQMRVGYFWEVKKEGEHAGKNKRRVLKMRTKEMTLTNLIRSTGFPMRPQILVAL